MRRRVPGDIAKVRGMKKNPFPLKGAEFSDQVDAAYLMYQEYSKYGGNFVLTDKDAFTAGRYHVFGWIEKEGIKP